MEKAGRAAAKRKVRVAVLISGGGTNLQAIIDRWQMGAMPHAEPVLVVSSRRAAGGLARAARADIEAVYIGKEHFEAELTALLHDRAIDLIVLAGFLRILSPEFVRAWPERILNVHPSLIPAFCGDGYYGLRVHEAALARGVKITGATVHFVNEVTDGGRILAQRAVAVEVDDTPEILQRRVMEEAEWQLLPTVVEQVAYALLREQRREQS